jgi:hypothetical protein
MSTSTDTKAFGFTLDEYRHILGRLESLAYAADCLARELVEDVKLYEGNIRLESDVVHFDYDNYCPYLPNGGSSFPAELLFGTRKDILAYKNNRRRIIDDGESAKREAEMCRQEEQERRQYEELKKKFEPKQA